MPPVEMPSVDANVYQKSDIDMQQMQQKLKQKQVEQEQQHKLDMLKKQQNAEAFVDMVITRRASGIDVGKAKYVIICNAEGGIINDPVLLRTAPDEFWFSLADGQAGGRWRRARGRGDRQMMAQPRRSTDEASSIGSAVQRSSNARYLRLFSVRSFSISGGGITSPVVGIPDSCVHEIRCVLSTVALRSCNAERLVRA